MFVAIMIPEFFAMIGCQDDQAVLIHFQIFKSLDYFTDLAIIRDHTMGYWIAVHVEDTPNRVFFVGGDWHVQTGIATPDIATLWSTAITSTSLITTTTRLGFDSLRAALFQGRRGALAAF